MNAHPARCVALARAARALLCMDFARRSRAWRLQRGEFRIIARVLGDAIGDAANSRDLPRLEGESRPLLVAADPPDEPYDVTPARYLHDRRGQGEEGVGTDRPAEA
jgi:hypothetical protein